MRRPSPLFLRISGGCVRATNVAVYAAVYVANCDAVYAALYVAICVAVCGAV